MLNKQLNFVQIVITSFIYNLFESLFIKKFYSNDSLLGVEIKDSKLRKMNLFKYYYKSLIMGYLVTTIWFVYIYNRLEFHILDDSKNMF
jgi:hypothetical protein